MRILFLKDFGRWKLLKLFCLEFIECVSQVAQMISKQWRPCVLPIHSQAVLVLGDPCLVLAIRNDFLMQNNPQASAFN